jgi:hypothetical protein
MIIATLDKYEKCEKAANKRVADQEVRKYEDLSTSMKACRQFSAYKFIWVYFSIFFNGLEISIEFNSAFLIHIFKNRRRILSH